MKTARTQPARRRGVTLVELLVSVALTLVILTAINVMFGQAQKLVSVGNGLSEVMINARAIGEQIERDAAMMLGPSTRDGGFLAIAQNIVGAADEVDDVEGDITAWNLTLANGRFVRDDQLFFFRHRGDMEPITPASPVVYAGNSSVSTQYVRVWYGHGRRTGGSGQDAQLDRNGGTAYTINDLRTPDQSAGDAAPIPGTNELASQWVLARQAMFLEPEPPTGPPPNLNIYIDSTDGWETPANTTSMSGWKTNVYGSPWYFSESDVIDLGMQEIFGPDSTQVFRPSSRAQTPAGSLDYNLDALKLGYVYINGRPRVITNPQVLANPPSFAQQPVNARQVAMMHPVLAVGVSDFAVDFAADLDKDGRVDVDDNPVDSQFPSGQIMWYGYYHNDPNLPLNSARRNPLDPDGPDVAFTLSEPVVHRATASLYGNPPTASAYRPLREYDPGPSPNDPFYAHAAYVWRHDDVKAHNAQFSSVPGVDGNASDWPYMIRIRYRLHDTRNNVGENNLPGRLFEHVIHVPRP